MLPAGSVKLNMWALSSTFSPAGNVTPTGDSTPWKTENLITDAMYYAVNSEISTVIGHEVKSRDINVTLHGRCY